jgi:hypothetical protein
MGNLLAIVIAVALAYAAVSIFWWTVWNIWWLTISLAKLILVALIALPLYVILRRKLARR